MDNHFHKIHTEVSQQSGEVTVDICKVQQKLAKANEKLTKIDEKFINVHKCFDSINYSFADVKICLLYIYLEITGVKDCLYEIEDHLDEGA